MDGCEFFRNLWIYFFSLIINVVKTSVNKFAKQIFHQSPTCKQNTKPVKSPNSNSQPWIHWIFPCNTTQGFDHLSLYALKLDEVFWVPVISAVNFLEVIFYEGRDGHDFHIVLLCICAILKIQLAVKYQTIKSFKLWSYFLFGKWGPHLCCHMQCVYIFLQNLRYPFILLPYLSFNNRNIFINIIIPFYLNLYYFGFGRRCVPHAAHCLQRRTSSIGLFQLEKIFFSKSLRAITFGHRRNVAKVHVQTLTIKLFGFIRNNK